MQSAAQVGTYELDGLLEGPLGPDPAAKARLADWVRIAQKAGYAFSLEVEGTGFSLLAEESPKQAPSVETDMSEPLRDLLQQLVQSFPPDIWGQLFSTVRSVQYSEGMATQTVYQIHGDGTVEAQQRVVDAATTKPAAPLTTKDKVRMAITGLVILLAIFGLSSFFIDWGDQISKGLQKIAPVDAEEVDVDLGHFAAYIEVEKKDVGGKGDRTLILTLKRREGFPTTEEARETMWRSTRSDPYHAALTAEAIVKGYAKFEVIGAPDKETGIAPVMLLVPVMLKELVGKETMEVRIPAGRALPPEIVRLVW